MCARDAGARAAAAEADTTEGAVRGALRLSYRTDSFAARGEFGRRNPSCWDEFFEGDDVFYGHVLGFKGLERPVVVLAVNGFRDRSRAKEMLYVGLSRARTQLVVCGDLDEIAAIGGEGVRKRLERASASD